MPGGQGLCDELKKSTVRTAGNDIERDELILKAHEVLRVGIEDAEIIHSTIIAAGSDTALNATAFKFRNTEYSPTKRSITHAINPKLNHPQIHER